MDCSESSNTYHINSYQLYDFTPPKHSKAVKLLMLKEIGWVCVPFLKRVLLCKSQVPQIAFKRILQDIYEQYIKCNLINKSCQHNYGYFHSSNCGCVQDTPCSQKRTPLATNLRELERTKGTRRRILSFGSWGCGLEFKHFVCRYSTFESGLSQVWHLDFNFRVLETLKDVWIQCKTLSQKNFEPRIGRWESLKNFFQPPGECQRVAFFNRWRLRWRQVEEFSVLW